MNLGLPEISLIGVILLLFGSNILRSKNKKGKSTTIRRSKASYQDVNVEYPDPKKQVGKSSAT